MWASYKGKEHVVDVLLERGADVNACGNFHIPSLIWAAGRGHTEIARKLIQAGAKINFGDKVSACICMDVNNSIVSFKNRMIRLLVDVYIHFVVSYLN